MFVYCVSPPQQIVLIFLSLSSLQLILELPFQAVFQGQPLVKIHRQWDFPKMRIQIFHDNNKD